MRALLPASLALALVPLCAPRAARADAVPREYQPMIEKGLSWLLKQQKPDGRWEGELACRRYPVAITAIAGMAILAEGSTVREGRHRTPLRKARDWLLSRAQPSGLIGNPRNPEESSNYMHGHGFAMLFLASLVGEEENADRRAELVRVLERAAKFARDAQSRHGGWWYTSARESGGKDEGSLTITQLQGLRAVRNAGIAVPAEAIKDGIKYLRASTNNNGGVRYSLTWDIYHGNGRPALSAAAISCGFSAGEYQGELVKKWLTFCRDTIPSDDRRFEFEEYTHYYYAQVVYVLGDDRYRKLFPRAKEEEVVTWSAYRKGLFGRLKQLQNKDGSWTEGRVASWASVGAVYATASYLTILQLDKGALPIYQR